MKRLSELLAERPDLDPEIEVEEGDLPTDVLVVLRLTQFDADEGRSSDCIFVGASDNLTGVIQYGMIMSARMAIEEDMAD